jgi:hypothetical protein
LFGKTIDQLEAEKKREISNNEHDINNALPSEKLFQKLRIDTNDTV